MAQLYMKELCRVLNISDYSQCLNMPKYALMTLNMSEHD